LILTGFLLTCLGSCQESQPKHETQNPDDERQQKNIVSNSKPIIQFHRDLIGTKPSVEGKNVRVWSIKKTETIRVNLVEMSGELSLHKHPDAEHSLLVLDGAVKVWVDGQTSIMREYDFISIPMNAPHKYESLTEKAYLVSMDAPYYDPTKTIRLEE